MACAVPSSHIMPLPSSCPQQQYQQQQQQQPLRRWGHCSQQRHHGRCFFQAPTSCGLLARPPAAFVATQLVSNKASTTLWLTSSQHKQGGTAPCTTPSPSPSSSPFPTSPSLSPRVLLPLKSLRAPPSSCSLLSSLPPLLEPLATAVATQPATWRSSLTVASAVFAAGLPLLLAGLTLPGILAAFVLGTLVWRAFSFPGFLVVCLYFALGTLVTKVRLRQKQREGIAEQRSGRRGPASVVGSGFAGALCSLAAILTDSWKATDVLSASMEEVAAAGAAAAASSSIWQLGFVASFATKLSDTVSSEIGKAYGKTTYLVTTFQPVPRGTEGAVSLEGTLAGLLAAVLVCAVAYATGQVSMSRAIIGVLASQVANFVESYIGATLQDKPGYEWLTNDIVNVLNVSVGASIAILLGTIW